MRDIKFEILWIRNNADFTKSIEKHYTTLDRLTNGEDKFPYSEVEVIAKRQYTGEKDIDDKELYHGDIVDVDGDTQVIKFDGGAFCVDVCGQDYDFTAIGWAQSDSPITKLGNILQNPELVGN